MMNKDDEIQQYKTHCKNMADHRTWKDTQNIADTTPSHALTKKKRW